MATAIFGPGMESAKTEDLWQYDYGQILRIEGLELPFAVEIHFSTQKKEGEAEKAMGVTKDGATEVRIPDSMLENQGSTSSYSIYAFIYLADETSGKTICWTQTRVKPRPKPVPERPDEEREDLFREAIRAVNDAAGRAETSAGEAGLSQEASSANAAKTAEDRQEIEEREKNMAAMEISMSENAELAERCKSQAQAAATNALQSEQAAKEAQAASEAARAGAETAESQAGLYAQRAEEDKDTVEQAKAVVMQLGREVTNNKDSVEKTTQGFALLAEQKTADINNAGQAQYDRIEEAREQAVGEIGTAKTQAAQAVQQEGAVQMQNVQEAAAAIEADREQIEINRAGIAALQEEAGNDAPGIACAASGKTILATDSSSKCFRGLRLYGRTTQETTTGANLFDVTKLDFTAINKSNAGIQLSVNDDRSITVTGYGNILLKTISIYYEYPREESLKLFNTNDMYSFNLDDTNAVPYVYASIRNSDGTIVSGTEISSRNGGIKSINFKQTLEDNEGSYVRIGLYGIEGTEVSTQKIYPMSHIGLAELPYEPFTGGTPSPNPDYPQELVSAGDKGNIETSVLGGNLLNLTDGSVSLNGVTAKIENGIVTIIGTTTALTILNIGSIKGLDDTKQYTLSGCPAGGGENTYRIDLRTQTNVVSGSQDYGNGATFSGASTGTVNIRIYSGVTLNNKVFKPMINFGLVPIPWEPYKHQRLTMLTPNGLPGIPVTSGGNYTDENGQQWIADYRDWERGMDVQMVAKEVPKTTFTVGETTDVPGRYRFAGALKNSYKNGTNPCLITHGEYSNYGANKNTWAISGVIFYYYPEEETTAEELKEKIIKLINSDNPLTFIGQLATPIETPIPADELATYQALHTNTPTTTITNDEDCWMEVGYTADTKAHIEQNYVPKESYMALEKRVAALETQAIENI